jgi:glycolate oxidase iron-sulfur subunit
MKLKTMDYRILQQCMHCGMCLPHCPTYQETGKEKHSPRGRIALMRAIADNDLSLNRNFAEEMSYCLGCLACTSACPADVKYAELFEAARSDIEASGVLKHPVRDVIRYSMIRKLFMNQRLMHAFGGALRVYQKLKLDVLVQKTGVLKLISPRLHELQGLSPRIQPRFSDRRIQPVETPAKPRYKVGMLTGCVQDIAFSDVNRDTVDVLLANHCEVHTPRLQGCCGSLHAHTGEEALAKVRAKALMDQFDLGQLDAVISNAGGCGSHLKHYGKLLADDPAYAQRARLWDSKLKDIHEWLDQIGLEPLPEPPSEPGSQASKGCLTYHESCHLCHGQKVSAQPRRLLDQLPGMRRTELPGANVCCGSAGIYNITQPEQAESLLKDKVEHVKATGADVVATANPGCHLQLQNGFRRAKMDVIVKHPVSLLAEGYRKG